MKRLLTFVTNALLLIVIFATAAFFIAPRYGLMAPIELKIVRSGSMEPSIPTGSLVLIQQQASYAVGEVITFGADTKTQIPTTHRVTAVHTEGTMTSYATKGDANEDPDPAATPANKVIGKVIFSLPYAGYILAFAKEPIGFATLIVIPAMLLIAYELINIWGEVTALARRKRAESALSKIAVREIDEVPERAPAPRISPVILGTHFDIEAPVRLLRTRSV